MVNTSTSTKTQVHQAAPATTQGVSGIIPKFTRLHYQHHLISKPRVIDSTPSVSVPATCIAG